MKRKHVVFFILVIVIGLFVIDRAVYPVLEEGCHCFGEDTEHTVCLIYCSGDSCGLNWSFQGSCDDWGFCVFVIFYDCIDTGVKGRHYTWNYCWECNDW